MMVQMSRVDQMNEGNVYMPNPETYEKSEKLPNPYEDVLVEF